MKKSLISALAIIFSLSATNALAEPETSWFVGVMAGDSSLALGAKAFIANESEPPVDYSFTTDDSQTLTLLVNGGYRFTDMIGIEGQIAKSLMDDKVFGAVKVNDSMLSEMKSSISAMGVFAVFRFGGEAYFKALAGFAKSGAKLETDFADAKYSTTGPSYGVSVGQKLGTLGSVELMYMRYPSVKAEKSKFSADFVSNPPFSSYTDIHHELKFQLLTLGYVFEF